MTTELALALCITFAISLVAGFVCALSSTLILLSSLPLTVKDERTVIERTLLPVLLPTLPQPHRCQARLPAPRAHVRLHSTAGDRRPSARCGFQCACAQRCVGVRRRSRGGQVEASPERASRVPVLAARAGHNRSVPHSLQSGKPSGMHVHSLCSQRQVGSMKSGAAV